MYAHASYSGYPLLSATCINVTHIPQTARQVYLNPMYNLTTGPWCSKVNKPVDWHRTRSTVSESVRPFHYFFLQPNVMVYFCYCCAAHLGWNLSPVRASLLHRFGPWIEQTQSSVTYMNDHVSYNDVLLILLQQPESKLYSWAKSVSHALT